MLERITAIIVAGLLFGCISSGWADPLPSGGAGQPLALSLTEAIQRGLAQNASLQAAAARVQGANARLRSARAPQNPILALAHGIGSGTGGLDEDILVTQVIPAGGKHRALVRGAAAERDAALAERADTTLATTYAIQSAYYESLRTEVAYRLAGDALATAQAFAKAAEVQFQAGDVAQNQVLRSKIEVSSAQQELDAAEVERQNSYAELNSLLGQPEDRALRLTDTLDVAPAAYQSDALVALGLQNRPDLRAERFRRQAALAAGQNVQAQSQPDFFWEARRASFNPANSDASLRVGITLPLWDLGQQRADMQAANAAVTEENAKTRDAERTARLEITTAYNSLQQARREVELFQNGHLAQAKSLLSMAQLGYEHGASSYLELLDAQHVYNTEEANYARAQANYHLALAALQRAVGGSLP